jgi:hypothetical protein
LRHGCTRNWNASLLIIPKGTAHPRPGARDPPCPRHRHDKLPLPPGSPCSAKLFQRSLYKKTYAGVLDRQGDTSGTVTPVHVGNVDRVTLVTSTRSTRWRRATSREAFIRNQVPMCDRPHDGISLRKCLVGITKSGKPPALPEAMTGVTPICLSERGLRRTTQKS